MPKVKNVWFAIYFSFNHGFEFQDYVCNGLTMQCLNISNIAVITVKNVDYRCIIHNINLLKNSVLENHGQI